jgi:hypothetical protein
VKIGFSERTQVLLEMNWVANLLRPLPGDGLTVKNECVLTVAGDLASSFPDVAEPPFEERIY